MDIKITGHYGNSPRHNGIAVAIKNETQKRLYKKFLKFHEHFNNYVSYPSEEYDAHTFFYVDNALKSLVDENTTPKQIEIHKVQIDMYKEALYETLETVKKELINI